MEPVVLAEGAQALINAVKPLFREPFEELGQMLADHVRVWRLDRAVKTVRRANDIREKNNIRYEIDPKFFLPFLKECSKEQNEDMSEMWSQLLASSSGRETGFDLICMEFLAKLGRADARLLREIDNSEMELFLEDARDEPSQMVLSHLTAGFARLQSCNIETLEKQLSKLANCPTQIYFYDENNHHEVEGHTGWHQRNIRSIMTLRQHDLICEEKLKLEDDGVRQSLTFYYIDLTPMGREFLARCGAR